MIALYNFPTVMGVGGVAKMSHEKINTVMGGVQGL